MPLYPYRCTECGHRFEKIQSFSAEPEKECPKCHGLLERPLTAPGLQFKGAGWYVTDYAGKKNTGAESTATDKSDSKETAAKDAAKEPAKESKDKKTTKKKD